MLYEPRGNGLRRRSLREQLAFLFVTDVAASTFVISGLCDGCLALTLAGLAIVAVLVTTLWAVQAFGRRGRQH